MTMLAIFEEVADHEWCTLRRDWCVLRRAAGFQGVSDVQSWHDTEAAALAYAATCSEETEVMRRRACSEHHWSTSWEVVNRGR